MKTDRARFLAVKAVLDVERGGYSNLVFKRYVRDKSLDERDVQFFARLFYGTIERTVTLDHILAGYLAKDIKSLDGEVRAILRCGLYQCLYMNAVPVGAAVNESVALCAALKKKSAGALVNAVLRRASAFDLDEIERIDDELKRLSLRYSVCIELADMLCSQYGDDAESILAATLERPPAALRVNTLKTTAEELTERLKAQGIETEAAPIPDALIVKSGRYVESAAIEDGSARIQSLAAQCAAHATGIKAGQSLLDMCAAPGGKTLTAAQMMGNSGYIAALDIHESRLAIITERAKTEGVDIVEVKNTDAATHKDERLFDAVLCDVPCSGYGEMAAKPELRHKPPEVSTLTEKQAAIVQNAASLVKSGGVIVYSTCTLDFRENEQIVDEFIVKNPEYKPVIPEIASCVEAKAEKYVKFVPNNQNSEGFFIATLRKMC